MDDTNLELNKNLITKENRFKSIAKTMYYCLTVLAALLTFSAATYAWFSSNSIVNTDRVVGRSGSDAVELQISSTTGENFKPEFEAALIQVNSSSAEQLMPVSTSDLKTFVYSASTVEGKATSFDRLKTERYYYHGRIYLRAAAEGHEGAKLALYLDGADNKASGFAQDAKGYMANAARLGLVIEGNSAKIMRLSEEGNPSNQQTMNAVVDGVEVKVGQVINGSADPMQIVNDPSVPITKYMIGEDGLAGNTSIEPLAMMELNRIYAVDVYFYLEGCDPDCTEVTRLDSLNLHLAFYGVLVEGAN